MYIQQGGSIMYLLLILNVVGMAIMAYKFFVLYTQGKVVTTTSAAIAEKISQIKEKDHDAKMQLAKQELNVYMSDTEKGLNTIRLIAAISPLLGLLGTVVGVFIAFKVIAEVGLSNPNQFAEGLSMALITTVGGLIVAIPHVVGHSYLIGLLDRLEVTLEKEIASKIL
jgi:biopolymer transport protein ExbB